MTICIVEMSTWNRESSRACRVGYYSEMSRDFNGKHFVIALSRVFLYIYIFGSHDRRGGFSNI